MNPEHEMSIADARIERASRPGNAKKCERCDRPPGHSGSHVVFAWKKTLAWSD